MNAAAHKSIARRTRILCAFTLAILSCLMGLFFCLIKSPQAKSEAYLAVALQAYDQHDVEQATSAAMEAVRYNPSSPRNWQVLSKLLKETGRNESASRANAMAARLQQNPSGKDPVYASPAVLKLSLLAEAMPETP